MKIAKLEKKYKERFSKSSECLELFPLSNLPLRFPTQSSRAPTHIEMGLVPCQWEVGITPSHSSPPVILTIASRKAAGHNFKRVGER